MFAAPALATHFSRHSGLPSILRFCLFFIAQQLLFAVAAAVAVPYFLSFPAAALLVALSAFWVNRSAPGGEAAAASFQNSLPYRILPWVITGIVFAGYAAIRANYSFINFNNNGDEAGVEKLFNLSLQQSFLFGEGYPPQWIWLSGEPIRYYVFLKSIPGLASWIARVLFGNAETGGAFFILSEAFFGSLPYGVLCGWVLWFGRGAKSRLSVCVIAAALSIFCLLGTHFHAFSLGLRALLNGAPLDWWKLSSEVIPFTDNQYPVWLMILGDNHAYMQVYFLQILFWGAFLRLLLRDERSLWQAASVGGLAAALVLSHPGSVLIDLSVFSVFLLMLGVRLVRSGQSGKIKLIILHGAAGAALTLFVLALLYSPVGAVKIVMPPRELASRAIAFLDLNFSVLLWAAMLAVLPSVFHGVPGRIRSNLACWPILILAVVCAAGCYIFGLPALCVTVLLGYLTYLALFRIDMAEPERILALFAVASFSIWIPPEIVAFDHTIDSRTSWIRFQMGLRFWPEGYFLIPFALTVALIYRVGEGRLPRAWMALASGVLLLFLASHVPGVKNRIGRSTQPHPSIDGFAEFSRRYPVDGALVSHLRELPLSPRTVIAESCGIGDPRVPHDFGWTGRIAAFSGRKGICGWARHAVLYNNPLEQTGFKGWTVEQRTATFLKAYEGFFQRLAAGQSEQAYLELMTLRALGVTHIVFGQFEKILFPEFSIGQAMGALPVSVEFDASGGMGILKINE